MIRINDLGNHIIVKPLNSYSFESVTPFQTNFRDPVEKNKKSLHQQSLLLNDTDSKSDDEEHICTRIPEHDSSFTSHDTLHDKTETYPNIKTLMSTTPHESASAMNVQTQSHPTAKCSQILPFYDISFFKYKNYFEGFFLPDDYSLDLKTLQQQQSQDPVLRTVYSWLTRNEKPEFLTTLITGTLFLHAFYKQFSQLCLEGSTNLISLYTTNTNSPATNQTSSPNIIRDTIRICLPFRMFRTFFKNLHEHSHTGITITYNSFSQY